MDFAYSDEQQMLVDSVRAFVEKELMPYEEEVERTDEVPPELIAADPRRKAIRRWASMPPTCRRSSAAAGSTMSALTLMERELGRTSFALQYAVARPSNILRACNGRAESSAICCRRSAASGSSASP